MDKSDSYPAGVVRVSCSLVADVVSVRALRQVTAAMAADNEKSIAERGTVASLTREHNQVGIGALKSN